LYSASIVNSIIVSCLLLDQLITTLAKRNIKLVIDH
jgi:hypothetical protein